MKHSRWVVALLLLAHLTAVAAAPDADTDSARDFFRRLVALSDSYDLGAAEMYSDAAVIHTSRRYPHGQQR